MQQTLLRPVKVHNLLIGKNILVRCNISNPALYHQFHDPVHTNHCYNTTQAADSRATMAFMAMVQLKVYNIFNDQQSSIKTGLFTPNAKKPHK